MKTKERTEKVIEIIKERGVLRPRDLDAYGIQREYLSRLLNRGVIARSGRGLYVLPDAEVTEHHTLAQVAKRVPNGVICLLSALQFHDMTTQMPRGVWMAIDHRAKQPRIDMPAARFIRLSGAVFREGVEEYDIENVEVKIFDPAKTVADCFKFRNKIGLDIAIEALRDGIRKKKCTVDNLWHYAKICRVSKIMRPYMEAML